MPAAGALVLPLHLPPPPAPPRPLAEAVAGDGGGAARDADGGDQRDEAGDVQGPPPLAILDRVRFHDKEVQTGDELLQDLLAEMLARTTRGVVQGNEGIPAEGRRRKREKRKGSPKVAGGVVPGRRSTDRRKRRRGAGLDEVFEVGDKAEVGNRACGSTEDLAAQTTAAHPTAVDEAPRRRKRSKK